MESDRTMDHTGKSWPICPHCGHVDRDWWDVSPPHIVRDDAGWEAECGTCGKTYMVTVHETITFDTGATGFTDGEPCSHPGCRNHVTHPCEGCGRQWRVEP
jgi:hypothetical protein